MFGSKRYNTLDYFYKNKFGSKVFKVSLDAGFTCPNIDGTAGYGGCIYCSDGSGEYAGNKNEDIKVQFEKVKNKLLNKWESEKYIAYFQPHTNTYAPVEVLRKLYEEALDIKGVIGLSIATRPDAINSEVLDYLEELNARTFLTVELGLQTIHERTSNFINRCHSLDCFENMFYELKKRNINVVVHIINGLPYETKEMMLETVKYLNKLGITGIKIHALHILSGTALEIIYKKKPFTILTRDEYVDIVCDQLELFNSNIVINRITGDAREEDLVEPLWTIKKFGVLNSIDKELKKRGTYQGFSLSIYNKLKWYIDKVIKNKDIVVTNFNDFDEYILQGAKDVNLIKLDQNLTDYNNKVSLVLLRLDTVDNLNTDERLLLLNNKGLLLILIDKNCSSYNKILFILKSKYKILHFSCENNNEELLVVDSKILV